MATAAHAKQRAAERYGLPLNRYAMRRMNVLARTGRVVVLSRDSGRSVCLLADGARTFKIVWDPRWKRIVTFLPMHYESADGAWLAPPLCSAIRRRGRIA